MEPLCYRWTPGSTTTWRAETTAGAPPVYGIARIAGRRRAFSPGGSAKQEGTGTYETGARTFGTLTSPAIDLASVSDAIVEWDQVLRVEGFGQTINLGSGNAAPYLNADAGRLLISVDGGSWVTLIHLAHNNSGGGFEHHKVNISRFAGGSARIRFDIDTIDATSNVFEGWFIDNVRVLSVPIAASFASKIDGPVGLRSENGRYRLRFWTGR